MTSSDEKKLEDMPVELLIEIMIQVGPGLPIMLKSKNSFNCIYNHHKDHILQEISKNTSLPLAILYDFKDLIMILVKKQPYRWRCEISRGLISKHFNKNNVMVCFLFNLKSDNEWLMSLKRNSKLLSVLSNKINSIDILFRGIVNFDVKIVKNSISIGTSVHRRFRIRHYRNTTPIELVRYLKLKYPVKTRVLNQIECLLRLAT